MTRKNAPLLWTLVGVAAAVAPNSASARVISNIAGITWTQGSSTRQLQSNRVDVTVQNAPPAPLSGNIYRFNPDGQGRSTLFDGSGCSTTGGQATPPMTAPQGFTAALQQTGQLHVGEMAAFGVLSAADNADPNLRERLIVTIRSTTGDTEQLTLVEDAPDSGFFVGFLPTAPIPPTVTSGDCRLSVQTGNSTPIELLRDNGTTLFATALVDFLVDPFGVVFDSGDGTPVAGSRVTLVDATTGAPARVFGDDGISAYPSTIITGSTVTDASGRSYAFPAGDYRFPFVAAGQYRLIVEPPLPYVWPSQASIADLAAFRRVDDGLPYAVAAASYGAVFSLITPAPVRIDIPVDRPGAAILLRKTSSAVIGSPGEAVQYRIDVRNSDAVRPTGLITITDILPVQMRIRRNSLRYDSVPIQGSFASDGRQFSVTVPSLPRGGSGTLTYLAEIRPDARPGDAVNTAVARDDRGTASNTADSALRIVRDPLGERITIIGRVTDGGCAVDPDMARGVANIRIMLQDGSFTVTDSDGRYHFEGIRPGLHVVQMDTATLPPGRIAANCAPNGRAAGSAISRFVEGRGGELRRADFRINTADGSPLPRVLPAAAPQAPSDAPEGPAASPVAAPSEAALPRPAAETDVSAAGGDRDWFAGQSAGIDWLFPATDHNPRSPAIRIAIKHLPGQTIALTVNGVAVDPLNFDGDQSAPDRSFAVALWRGVEIRGGDNLLVARVLNADGTLAEELRRTVHSATGAMNAAVVRETSLLIADGVHRPVIAVRLTDRDGRPVGQGVTGDVAVAPPHRAAQELDAEQARQLSGLDRAAPMWRVQGDDGIAYIELDPTTASGTARMVFTFRDGDVTRRQTVELWLNPGDRPWTVVGFAAGTVGYNTLNDHIEDSAETLPGDNIDGRIALYATGRVRGSWLMTMAYDSDREADDARFGGVIDPRAYYTVYADRADRGFDAATVRNLYLRLERPQFYALFGDFETGINEPVLMRYQRAVNGARAEYRGENFAATAFAADTPYRHRRDELQGNGLSGPYQLGARDILANSERIVIEVRDRLRADRIVETRVLSRHADYDIDYFAGTLRFREPILSRDSGLNPQFIVADYEVDGVGARVLNAGGRATWTNEDESVRLGATAIHDETDSARTNAGGVDLRIRPTAATEIRAELAYSDRQTRAGALGGATDGGALAWLVEAEHHDAAFDILAYVREQNGGFGVGQTNASTNNSRRFGADGRLRVGHDLSLLLSGWQDDMLDTGAMRRAVRMLGEYRTADMSLRAGLTYADDQLSDGGRNQSTLLQVGGSRFFLNRRLELDAQTEFALGGQDNSVDFPTRHRFGARYAINSDVSLVGSYEIADGGSVSARTVRAGFDMRPWAGGRILANANRQNFAELGARSFAAYGLAQSFEINQQLTVDFTVDGQRTLGGIRARDVIDLDQPVATGGFLGSAGQITEDFLAVTAGATWRNDDWSITGRAEYRDGELTDRAGVTLGALRRLGEGRSLGALASWTRAETETGLFTETLAGELSWAHRPADSRLSWLDKLEAHSDRIRGAVAGLPGPIGGPGLLISGDAVSRRVVNSLSVNYSPLSHDADMSMWNEAGEYALFWGVRYASQQIDLDDIGGWSTVVGADLRFDLSDVVGVGAAGNVRVGTDARTVAWSAGPQIVLTPMPNANLVIGYNFAGFNDRDFEDSRYSRSGIYLTFRLKFDQTSLAGLTGRRP